MPQGTSDPQPSLVEGADYAALEATLRSTELGRRFLADYARHHPTPEVQLLLDAVARLESAAIDPGPKGPSMGLIAELVAMSETIGEMRREISHLGLTGAPDGSKAAPCAFDQIVAASARATSDVLMALEELQNVSWTLREQGVAPEQCDQLDDSAADIYTACARQEIAGQQAAEVMRLLRDTERRIDALIEEWSDHETQNLLDAAKALDVSEAFEIAAPQSATGAPSARNGVARDGVARSGGRTDPPAFEMPPQERVRPNRLVPSEDVAGPGGMDEPSQDKESSQRNSPSQPTEPAGADGLFDGAEARPFERPEPLTLEALVATQRAALFG